MTDKRVKNLTEDEAQKWTRWRLTLVIRDILKLTETNFIKVKRYIVTLLEEQKKGKD